MAKRPETDDEKYRRHTTAISEAHEANRNIYASIADKHAAEAAAIEACGGIGKLDVKDEDDAGTAYGTRYDPKTGEARWQSKADCDEGGRIADRAALKKPAANA